MVGTVAFGISIFFFLLLLLFHVYYSTCNTLPTGMRLVKPL